MSKSLCDRVLRETLLPLLGQVHLVESVALALELQGCSDLEHHTYRAGENMECLHCLMLYVLVLNEGDCLLGTAEEDVHDLLCLHGVELEPEDVLDNELIHVIESACSVQ